MNIHESAEDYLESIYMVQQRQGQVRSIDIASELSVSKPSVSVAMKKLRENGYITMADDGHISLLPAGLEIAQRMYSRHSMLTKYFIHIGVNPETAAEDACKIEHHLSDETFEKLQIHAKSVMEGVAQP